MGVFQLSSSAGPDLDSPSGNSAHYFSRPGHYRGVDHRTLELYRALTFAKALLIGVNQRPCALDFCITRGEFLIEYGNLAWMDAQGAHKPELPGKVYGIPEAVDVAVVGNGCGEAKREDACAPAGENDGLVGRE